METVNLAEAAIAWWAGFLAGLAFDRFAIRSLVDSWRRRSRPRGR